MLAAAGVTRIMTMDLHADQIQGFFEVPVDHLFASTIFIPYIKSLNLENLTMASPDMGGTKRANAYAKFLHAEVAVCYKQRKKANVIEDMFLIGDVEGKDATHPILSGEAYERIENSELTELIVTDSIPLSQQSSKIKVLSVADLFSHIIKKVFNHESISESFIY